MRVISVRPPPTCPCAHTRSFAFAEYLEACAALVGDVQKELEEEDALASSQGNDKQQ